MDDRESDELYSPLSQFEIAQKLQSAANTAPGADHVEYGHLKRIDPSGKILALIFNRCRHQKDVPPLWKTSKTVLIYKKGDESDVSNFRPIAMMSCIYKLFTGVLAKRLT